MRKIRNKRYSYGKADSTGRRGDDLRMGTAKLFRQGHCGKICPAATALHHSGLHREEPRTQRVRPRQARRKHLSVHSGHPGERVQAALHERSGAQLLRELVHGDGVLLRPGQQNLGRRTKVNHRADRERQGKLTQKHIPHDSGTCILPEGKRGTRHLLRLLSAVLLQRHLFPVAKGDVAVLLCHIGALSAIEHSRMD